MNEESEQKTRKKRQALALRHIDYLRGQHYSRVFHAASDADFTAHAQDALKYFRIAFPESPLQVRQSMKNLAEYIEQCALEYPDSNGHHHRAAEKIRECVADVFSDQCPWSGVRVCLEQSRTLRTLADHLWSQNRFAEKQWTADYARTIRAVWGHQDQPAASTVRSAASKLSKLLAENGVDIKISVQCNRSAPVFECKVS